MATVKGFYDAMHTPRVRFRVGGEKKYLIPYNMISKCGLLPLGPINAPETDQTVELEGISPGVFHYFYYYTHHLDVKFSHPPSNYYLGQPQTDSMHAEREVFTDELCQVWVFGDKYDIPGLQNCAMLKLCEILRERHGRGACMTEATLRFCYESTKPGAKLRNLAVDYLVRALECAKLQPKDPSIIDTMSVYHGFPADLYEALNAWHNTKAYCKEIGMMDDWWCARFARPLKFKGRYEVAFDQDPESFPIGSRAVWTIIPLLCADCGIETVDDDGPKRLAYCMICGHIRLQYS